MTGVRAVKWSLGGLTGVALLLLCGAALWQLHLDSQIVHPTPDTQSSFFKTYTPEGTTAAFDLKKGGSSNAGITSRADTGFAEHHKEMNFYFVINAKDRVATAEAESADASSQLLRSGAKIVSTYNPAQGKYLFRYACGQTLGEVVIDPVELDVNASYGTHLSSDQIPVVARVTVSEKWFMSTRPSDDNWR